MIIFPEQTTRSARISSPPPYEALFGATFTTLAILLGVVGLLLGLHEDATTIELRNGLFGLILGATGIAAACAAIGVFAVKGAIGSFGELARSYVALATCAVLVSLPIGMVVLIAYVL